MGRPTLLSCRRHFRLGHARILANHLLTLGRRTNDTVMPSQWLIIGGLALPLIMCAADFVLDLHDAVLESMAILPMLASGLAVALYVAPFASGTPLWSRTLAGATVLMTFVTLSPIGIDGEATPRWATLQCSQFSLRRVSCLS